MKKVLLVIDEIQQLHGLESFLRRLGFDVLSLAKDILVSDAILSFVPEIVIASQMGRNVDGVRLAQRLKKSVVPVPRIALCFTGAAPIIDPQDLRSVDAFLQLPLAGESGIRLLAQLAGLAPEPLVEKYRKIAGAKLSSEEQVVVITGTTADAAPTPAAFAEDWDPKKQAGQSADLRTSRSDRYDQFLESRAKEFERGVMERVLPKERAQQAMSQLRKDSDAEKAELDRIHAEKIKFVETMLDEGKKKT